MCFGDTQGLLETKEPGFLKGSAPLTAVQLLWVNMIMDTLGALALATEPPTDELMERLPVGRKGNFITNVMWRNIMGQSLYQFVVIWYLQTQGKSVFCLDDSDSDLVLNTLIFNSFVFCQVFNEISSREMEKIDVFKGMLKNYVFLGVLTCTVIFPIISIEFLGSAPLTAVQLLWVNMIMDTLGALALATEPPTDELMERLPVGRKGNFITNVMWRNIMGQSLYQFVVIWYLQTQGKSVFYLDNSDSDLVLNTLIFNSFVFCQVFNEISSREMEKIDVFKGMVKNYVFLGVLTCTVIFPIISIEFLGSAPLTAVQLLWVNMIMDTLGALALATEPHTNELMERLPVGRKGNFITNVMWRNIMGQSLYQFVVIWYLQTQGKSVFCLDNSDSDLVLNTLIFNSFVFCQGGYNKSLPDEFGDLVDKKYGFKIDITNYNVMNKCQFFTISKMTNDSSIIGELEKNFNLEEFANYASLNDMPADLSSHEMDDSQTADNVTPISKLNEIDFISKADKVKLKRSLDEIYDVDEPLSYSSTKARQSLSSSGKEDKFKLLTPKLEK
ncbi:hypothetical protein E3N88_15043 [Mikania micrantha]|uniref:Cation-transporting P-type ATPase C-terminal domain-containing protein n=1 Tax=Mikania micrantha TaxID=192012 RepID=A0A5N6P558_9ASTR|nr:hypothetical protein E3N88_15043 [Mikania micrantha]